MSERRPPILIAGDAAVPTGFARVNEGIFVPLHEKYEIHHLGTNYHGDPHQLPWKVYPASVGGGTWGAHRLEMLIDKVQPGLIFVVNDIWVAKDYLGALANLAERPPVVLYCPVDAGPIEREAMLPLGGVERFVTYTEFGRREVEAAVAEARSNNGGFAFPEVEVLPHGVDADVFHPLDGACRRRQARRVLFPDREDLDDAFIVLNANRNQPRKRIDITMEGFALFARDKPENVKLYLHMGVQDQGWNVIQLGRRLGIEDRLILSTFEPALPPFTTNHLNHVYNACDVGLNTAIGEGWGLVSFEHAATRAAQVVPAKGPTGELWGDAGLLLEPAMKTTTQQILTDGWLIAPETVAGALEKLYGDRGLLEEMGERAYANATRTELSWGEISKRWDALFQDVLEGA